MNGYIKPFCLSSFGDNQTKIISAINFGERAKRKGGWGEGIFASEPVSPSEARANKCDKLVKIPVGILFKKSSEFI